jgi:hypothetical protein
MENAVKKFLCALILFTPLSSFAGPKADYERAAKAHAEQVLLNLIVNALPGKKCGKTVVGDIELEESFPYYYAYVNTEKCSCLVTITEYHGSEGTRVIPKCAPFVKR